MYIMYKKLIYSSFLNIFLKCLKSNNFKSQLHMLHIPGNIYSIIYLKDLKLGVGNIKIDYRFWYDLVLKSTCFKSSMITNMDGFK